MNLLPPSQSSILLSDDLIAEVFSFLPVKSLMRLKCLNKSWKLLISEPTFSKLHLNRFAQNADHTIVSYDMSTHCGAVSFTVFRLLETPPFIINLPEDPYYQLDDKDCCCIVGSCNGLLCLYGYSYANGRLGDIWLRFWNPATRTISKKLGSRRDDTLGFPFNLTFGYDKSTDTFKVVYFLPKTRKVRVFSLGNNVWRNIQDSPEIHRCSRMKVVHVSGSVNWLAIRNYTIYHYNCEDINTIKQFVIISLDLGTETHTQLLPPHGFHEVPFVEPNLSVLKDCLCFSHDFEQTHFVIWQMKEFGVQESWTQLLKISYHNLQIDDHLNDLKVNLLPLGLSDRSNTLLLTNYFFVESQLILYNWRDNRAERINKRWSWNDHDYVESLVSYC